MANTIFKANIFLYTDFKHFYNAICIIFVCQLFLTLQITFQTTFERFQKTYIENCNYIYHTICILMNEHFEIICLGIERTTILSRNPASCTLFSKPPFHFYNHLPRCIKIPSPFQTLTTLFQKMWRRRQTHPADQRNPRKLIGK